MEHGVFDVIVIGAGAAGLMAAWELVQAGRKVVILEARDRAGGRIHTATHPQFDGAVELGAEFVHGKLPNTLRLLKSAGLPYNEVEGDFFQVKNGTIEEQGDFIEDYSLLEKKFNALTHDIPVSQFLSEYLTGNEAAELRFSLRNYVEGYYAGDLDRVSTFALREELNGSEDVQYRIEGGYGSLINYLLNKIRDREGHCLFNMPVTAIAWQKGSVTVFSGDRSWRAMKAIVTVPVGVLQSDQIRFQPALPEKMEAVAALGYGPVVKTLMQFRERFWADATQIHGKDLDKMSFVFSDAVIPTWWTQYPRKAASITGWSGGPHAMRLHTLSQEEVITEALGSLGRIFQRTPEQLRTSLTGALAVDWQKDPYSAGAYSYQVVNGSALIQTVKQPVEGTLFFAGEGLCDRPEIGTVEAALASGRETAFEVIVSF